MKVSKLTAIAVYAMAMISCNEDTGGIGASLTDESDKLEISTGFFKATTKSILVDSVYTRNFACYLGQVKDPETGAYVKSEFMAQFNMLEGFTLPDKSQILSEDNGDIAADSCEIRLFFDRSECYGDSLAPVKLNVVELEKPLSDTKLYYSNFDPRSEGYVRTAGLRRGTAFSLANLTYSDSIRSISGYGDLVRIPINEPYTDKDGKTYNNYGTYLLRSYYEHPEYFKNSYSFVHSLCPGFYYEVSDGLGVMAKIGEVDLLISYRYKNDTSTVSTSMISSSTPEVLQTSRVINDRTALQRLVSDQNCTYIKAPAGIFTEVTLPVDEITTSHASDSLLSVSIAFQRENVDQAEATDFLFEKPSYILMIQKDQLNTFFENETMYDNKTTYLSSILTANAYTFNNIGNIITSMAHNKADGLKTDANWTANNPDWNKVLLVPVAVTKTESSDYYGNKTTTITGIGNQMGLSSTKLVGGSGHPIEVKVIYAKFQEK